MAVSIRAGKTGLRAFRLSEVPEQARLAALDKLLKTPGSANGMLLATDSFVERIALGAAATNPSERVYWISRAAFEKVVPPRRGRR